jgi:hypothetical protein
VKDREPTARARVLGGGLLELMERRRVSRTAVERVLHWPKGRVSRMVSGTRAASVPDVMCVLTVCRAEPADRDRLVPLCDHITSTSWLRSKQDPQHDLQTIVIHEAHSSRITYYGGLVIPDVLRTESYARALMESRQAIEGVQPAGVLNAQLRRPDLLSRSHRPTLNFYVHEHALRLAVGDHRRDHLRTDRNLRLIDSGGVAGTPG